MHNHMVPSAPPYPEDWAPLTGSLFPPCPILTTLPSCFSPSSAGVWLEATSPVPYPTPNPVTTNVTQKGCKEKRSGAIKKQNKKHNSSNRKYAVKVRESVTPGQGSFGAAGLHLAATVRQAVRVSIPTREKQKSRAGGNAEAGLAHRPGRRQARPEPHTVDVL